MNSVSMNKLLPATSLRLPAAKEIAKLGPILDELHRIAQVYTSFPMKIEWDRSKRLANLPKHGVDLSDAVGVLEDMRAITVEDTHHEEQRFKTLGIDYLRRLLVVAYAHSGTDAIRIISAHKATKRERQQYEARI